MDLETCVHGNMLRATVTALNINRHVSLQSLLQIHLNSVMTRCFHLRLGKYYNSHRETPAENRFTGFRENFPSLSALCLPNQMQLPKAKKDIQLMRTTTVSYEPIFVIQVATHRSYQSVTALHSSPTTPIPSALPLSFLLPARPIPNKLNLFFTFPVEAKFKLLLVIDRCPSLCGACSP